MLTIPHTLWIEFDTLLMYEVDTGPGGILKAILYKYIIQYINIKQYYEICS